MDALICTSCATPNEAGARFCFKCGQALVGPRAPAATGQTQDCWQCAAVVPAGFRFCGGCGADLEFQGDVTESSLGDGVVDALGKVLSPYGTVVLLKRPGTKRPRRCQVATGIPSGDHGGGWDVFSEVLEETLLWDGFLFGEVANSGPQYVWHILDSRIFPLGAEHGAAVLMYLEDLQPYGWSDVQLFRVLDAPSLEM